MKKAAPFVLLIVLFAVAAWYFFTREPDVVHDLPPALPAETQQTEARPEAVPVKPAPESVLEPVPEPEPEIVPEPLPLLNESDREVSQAMTEIVGTAPLAEYLVQGQAISRLVTTIDRLASRQVPPLVNPIKPAADKFVVDSEGEHVVLSARNYARYDGHVTLMQSTNAGVLVMQYQRYYPLFQQAYEENGGVGSFNDRLVAVIDHLLETPDVPGPIYLTKPEAVYVFEDPGLEAMTAGQKILVRMGPANAAIVKEKLAEIRSELKP
jgi:hypothetical protein